MLTLQLVDVRAGHCLASACLSHSPWVQEANSSATDLALLLFKDYVRRWLMNTHGYECQEAEGEFMLAFSSPLPAVQFCLLVRRRCVFVQFAIRLARCCRTSTSLWKPQISPCCACQLAMEQRLVAAAAQFSEGPSRALPDAGQNVRVVQVQDAMMQGMWVDDVLALPNCGAELGDNAQVPDCTQLCLLTPISAPASHSLHLTPCTLQHLHQSAIMQPSAGLLGSGSHV